MRWFRKKPVEDVGRTSAERLRKLRRAEVYYLPITKCGSTYLKNLFYYLDNGAEHPGGPDIHNFPSALIRADSDEDEKVRQSGHAFTVLRDPVDRFVSLYFDKIWRDGPRNMPDLRLKLKDTIGLRLDRDLTVDEHRENCRKLIDWLERNLNFETDEAVNAHWRRQASRLKRVKDLDLTCLTLDGLDWQLPLLLGDVLPDIRDAMAAVKEKNRIPKPFSRQELLDEALIAKIEHIYKRDVVLYQEASRHWQSAKPDTDAADETLLKVISAGQLPIYYVATLKVGCTYLKNLFYCLEHGRVYDDPSFIHGQNAGSRAYIARENPQNDIRFFVVRDPVDRFLSLYFDKVIGTGPQAFDWIGKQLAVKRGFVFEPKTLGDHRTNLNSLIGYLKQRIEKFPPSDLNPHWRPQIEVAKKVEGFGFEALLLERLDDQLTALAADRIPDITAAMDLVRARNQSNWTIPRDEVMTPTLTERVEALYAEDVALYRRVKESWDGKT